MNMWRTWSFQFKKWSSLYPFHQYLIWLIMCHGYALTSRTTHRLFHPHQSSLSLSLLVKCFRNLDPWDISIQCMVAAKKHLLILSQPWINNLIFPNDISNLWSQSLPSPWQHQDNKLCCVLPLWIVMDALILFFRSARGLWGMLIRHSCGTALRINTKTNLFQTILKHTQKNFIQRQHIIAFDLHITHNDNIFETSSRLFF